LLVGGCVRDALKGLPPKDTDIEVFGLGVTQLKRTLAHYGRVFAVGVSFGVLKVYLSDGTELDVSIPRRESSSGQRGWMVEPDPNMTLEEAAARRDFTINAMSYDPASGELLDFYNGQVDLAAGILRHTSAAFAEDPLRVLRAMQFAARWNFRLAPETIELCASLRSEYPNLARMRVWLEWQKLAEKGAYPAMGLQILEQTGWRACYPGLEALSGFPIASDTPSEENAWTHTLQVAEASARIAEREGLLDEERVILVLGAICSNLGKPVLAGRREAEGQSLSESEVGVAEAERFLKSIGCTNQLLRRLKPLVRELIAFREAGEGSSSPGLREVRHLAQRLAPATIVQWERLVEATGIRAGFQVAPVEKPARAWLELAQQDNCADHPVEPLLLGRHLQEMGLQPGPRFRAWLTEALEAQLEGAFSTLEEAQVWLTQKLTETSKKNRF
jgi:tRNA nucleotidyltransferase (CCA-adding enzyme)